LQLVRFPEGQTALYKMWRMQLNELYAVNSEFIENSEGIDAHCMSFPWQKYVMG
jgi:hypothetical protein